MRPEVAIAWLAGLYEGEGTLVRHRDRGDRSETRAWTLAITMSDEDVIRRAHGLTGMGKVRETRYSETRTYWRWNVCASGELAEILPRLLPYLGARRAARVRECLAWLEAKEINNRQQRGSSDREAGQDALHRGPPIASWPPYSWPKCWRASLAAMTAGSSPGWILAS